MLPEPTVENLVLARIPRTGLGHALGLYARAFLYAAKGQARFVHPNWFKLRLGPYLRREADKRNYHRIIRVPTSWGLPRRHACRRFWMTVVDEDSFDPSRASQFLVVKDDGPLHPRTISWMKSGHPFRRTLASALESISVVAPARRKLGTRSIGIFHRSGDFRGIRPSSGDARTLRVHGYGYRPPEYAAEALAKLREIAGWQVPAVLSTDAAPDEVAVIIRQGGVQLSQTKSALANMLEMSQHDVLIVGTSSYANWAWFLSDALAVTPRYDDRDINIIGVPEREYAWFVFGNETSLADATISARFARKLQRV